MSEPLANSLRVAFLQYEGLPLQSTARLRAHVGTLLRDEAQFHSLLATVRLALRRVAGLPTFPPLALPGTSPAHPAPRPSPLPTLRLVAG